MGKITSEADRTCFYRGIALVFHLHTSSPLCPFTVLCVGICWASAQKQEQCSPVQLLLSSSLKNPQKAKERRKNPPKLPNLAPVFHQFTAESHSHHHNWARLCWCLLCSERPEALGNPNLFPGYQKAAGSPGCSQGIWVALLLPKQQRHTQG